MGANTIISPEEVWDYFLSHKEELETEPVLLAEYSDFGIEIWLNIDFGDLPEFSVLMDYDEVWSERAVSKHDCETTLREIYEQYLDSSLVSHMTEGQEDMRITDEMESIDDRELDLDVAICELIKSIVPTAIEEVDNVDDFYEDLKEHICEYLYTTHGVSIYRPMYLEDEDGIEHYVEFPYPEMDLD